MPRTVSPTLEKSEYARRKVKSTYFFSKKIETNGIYLCGYGFALCKILFFGSKRCLLGQFLMRIGRKNQRIISIIAGRMAVK